MQIATNPTRAVEVAQDDRPAFIGDLDDAAGGKVVDPEGFLEMLDLDADPNDGSQPSGRIFHAAGNGGYPISGGATAHRIADRDAWSACHNPPEIVAVAVVDTAAFGRLERCADILAVERRHQNAADVIG